MPVCPGQQGIGAAFVPQSCRPLLTAGALKSRSSRSPARVPSLPGTVVRAVLPRRTPVSLQARIARSTAPALAPGALVRRKCAVIFRRPYSPSGASRRTRSEPVVHAASRTALRTWASVTVWSATGRDGRFHSRQVRAATWQPYSRRTRQIDSTPRPAAACSAMNAMISGCGGRAPRRSEPWPP